MARRMEARRLHMGWLAIGGDEVVRLAIVLRPLHGEHLALSIPLPPADSRKVDQRIVSRAYRRTVSDYPVNGELA